MVFGPKIGELSIFYFCPWGVGVGTVVREGAMYAVFHSSGFTYNNWFQADKLVFTLQKIVDAIVYKNLDGFHSFFFTGRNKRNPQSQRLQLNTMGHSYKPLPVVLSMVRNI